MELLRILKVSAMFLSVGWVVYFQMLDGLDQNLSVIHSLQIIKCQSFILSLHSLPKNTLMIIFLQTLKERTCVPILFTRISVYYVILYELLAFVLLPNL